MFRHLEAEQKLIGILIQYPAVFVETADRLRAEDFSDQVYRITYDELRDMYLEKPRVEISELVERVERKTDGPAFAVLHKALEEGVSAASTDWALERVIDASRRRYLDRQMQGMLDKLRRAEDVRPLFAELMTVAVEGRSVSGAVYDGEMSASRIVERQERRRKAGDTVEGYRTGWGTLDFHLGGLVPKRMTILSGPSGHGKTSVVVNWLTRICVLNGVPGLFASLEMGVDDIEDRILSILSGEVLAVVKEGKMTTRIYEALEHYKAGALQVSDNYPRDIHDVAFMAERYARTHGVKILVVDYVGELVRDLIKAREERDERFARWTKILRDLSKRLDIHVVLVAQVNYEGMLAESKKMAHIADAYLHFERGKDGKHRLECRKNRFGPTGYRYEIAYDRQTQRMREVGILESEKKEA